jgi:hypothetical protein
MHGRDFIHSDLPESDVRLFGLDDPSILLATDWESLAVECGLFPSKGQARKAGWAGPIEPGFSLRTIKKRRFTVTVLNWFVD